TASPTPDRTASPAGSVAAMDVLSSNSSTFGGTTEAACIGPLKGANADACAASTALANAVESRISRRVSQTGIGIDSLQQGRGRVAPAEHRYAVQGAGCTGGNIDRQCAVPQLDDTKPDLRLLSGDGGRHPLPFRAGGSRGARAQQRGGDITPPSAADRRRQHQLSQVQLLLDMAQTAFGSLKTEIHPLGVVCHPLLQRRAGNTTQCHQRQHQQQDQADKESAALLGVSTDRHHGQSSRLRRAVTSVYCWGRG